MKSLKCLVPFFLRPGCRYLPLLLVATMLVIANGPLASAQTYHLTDLGVLPGQTVSHANAINNHGEVTGTSGSFAFLYRNGAMENLGTLPGGTVSAGRGINNSAQVSGDSNYTNSGGIRHATLYSNGGKTDLGTLPLSGNYSFGLAINDSTQVVGYSGISGSTTYTRAFLWDPTHGIQDIGTLGGQYA